MEAVGVGAFTIPPGTRFRRHEHAASHVVAVLAGGFVEREARHDCGAYPGADGILGVSGGT